MPRPVCALPPKQARPWTRSGTAAARQHSREPQARLSTSIFSFEPSKKREILSSVAKRVEVTGDMTIAARNRRIESDDDLDSFLEACLQLGLIDESGKLKE